MESNSFLNMVEVWKETNGGRFEDRFNSMQKIKETVLQTSISDVKKEI